VRRSLSARRSSTNHLAQRVADVIAYLAALPADVVLRAVTKGPFARRRHEESGKPRTQ